MLTPTNPIGLIGFKIVYFGHEISRCVLWTRYFVYVGHEVPKLRNPNFEGRSYQHADVEKESRSRVSKFAQDFVFAGGQNFFVVFCRRVAVFLYCACPVPIREGLKRCKPLRLKELHRLPRPARGAGKKNHPCKCLRLNELQRLDKLFLFSVSNVRKGCSTLAFEGKGERPHRPAPLGGNA